MQIILQTQHQIELDKRDGKLGGLHPVAMAVPPMQQMSRIDHQIPPSVGYPPQLENGQYGYPYPPQAQGYPQAAYPPPAYPPGTYPPPPPPTYTNDQYPPPNHHPTYKNDQYPPLNPNLAHLNDANPLPNKPK